MTDLTAVEYLVKMASDPRGNSGMATEYARAAKDVAQALLMVEEAKVTREIHQQDMIDNK